MSEYQYYEFQAIDRPLSEEDRSELRSLSTRAKITSRSFINSYEWGDFRGDPIQLVKRWFDLHLYFANWGSRRLMIRLPKQLVDQGLIEELIADVECAELKLSGDNLILDVQRDELEPAYHWDDGDDSDQLAALAPLRDDLLAGDLRLLYLLWLAEVEIGAIDPARTEPLPGLGPMTKALEAAADFFQVDPDLVAAAAKRTASQSAATRASSDSTRRIIAALSDDEKTAWLARVADGDPHVAGELRLLISTRSASERVPVAHSAEPPRTAGEIRKLADEIRDARERAEADREAAAARLKTEQKVQARRGRVDAIAKTGADIWQMIEAEIMRRNPKGYDAATDLLYGLKAIAEGNGTAADFRQRLSDVRERHVNKERFLERLVDLE